MTTMIEKKNIRFSTKIMELFYANLLLVGIMGLEAGLVYYLIESTFFGNYGLIIPIVIPAAFLVVIGSMLLVNRVLEWHYAPRSFEFKRMFVFSGKPKKEEKKKGMVEKKILKARTLAAPKVEYGTHNCPQHGVEKCIGSFSNIHSCNSSEATKAIFWQE